MSFICTGFELELHALKKNLNLFLFSFFLSLHDWAFLKYLYLYLKSLFQVKLETIKKVFFPIVYIYIYVYIYNTILGSWGEKNEKMFTKITA